MGFVSPLERSKSANIQLKSQAAIANSVNQAHNAGDRPTANDSLMGVAGVGTLDSTKVNTRLKEVFREKISQYREAIYLLFGYKVDLHGSEANGAPLKLRLRSMYAENENDDLILQWTGDGLELMATPFVNRGIDDKLLGLLRTSNSIPLFLSNLTSELFEKQTLMP